MGLLEGKPIRVLFEGGPWDGFEIKKRDLPREHRFIGRTAAGVLFDLVYVNTSSWGEPLEGAYYLYSHRERIEP